MRRLFAPLAVALLLSACGPAEEEEALPERVALAQTGTLEVELLSHRPLAVGLNEVFYRVRAQGETVRDATLVQRPLMAMTNMSHGCPKIDPSSTANADGLFEGALIFNMASNDMESWGLTVEVTLPGEATASVAFENLPVGEGDARRSLQVDTTRYLVTLNFDEGAPRVGTNPYTVSVHRVENMMMSFVPMEGFTLELVPEMPSMGHGSSGNVAPTHRGNGLYGGSVNFSMAGDWTVHLTLQEGETALGELDWSFML